jgi:hypothetical protein
MNIPFNILSPHLHIAAYEFSIVQSSAACHQLTPCSADPPFFISPLQQSANEFLSMHFSVWGTGKCHRVLNLVRGGGQALKSTYQLKTASLQGHCELVHCCDAESMISSSTIPAFSSLFLELGQDLQVVLLINCLTLRYPFNHGYASDVTENSHHCLHFLPAHYWFFSFSVNGCLLMHQLPHRFWIILKSPCFITCDNIFKHIRLFCDLLQDISKCFSGFLPSPWVRFLRTFLMFNW